MKRCFVGIGKVRAASVVLLVGMALLLSRCISAEEKDLVTYDAATDQFRMLMVLTDIKVKDADDLEYLEGVYKNRDHWIAPIVPGGSNWFPMLGFSAIRAGDQAFAGMNLFGPRPADFDVTKTQTSLKDITITPGRFFVEKGGLGYYQAVTVPGKTIDSALAELSTSTAGDMEKGIDAEIERRAGGGATHTWPQLKDLMLKQMAIETKPEDDNSKQINPLTVLDAESLKNLKAALAGKTLRLVREKTAIVLALPVSAADAAGCADLVSALSKRMDEMLVSTKVTPENADQIQMVRAMQAALTAMTLTPGEKGLRVSADILQFAKASAGLAPHRVDMNEKAGAPEKAPPDALTFLREKKIPVDEKLTAAEVIKEFDAGTLKGNPSDSPVKPGEGIVKPKDAGGGMP